LIYHFKVINYQIRVIFYQMQAFQSFIEAEPDFASVAPNQIKASCLLHPILPSPS
jgi:hypothetical protein